MCAHEGGLTEPAAAADAAEAGEYAAGATNESSSAAAVSTAPESGDALAPADKPVARPAGGAARRGDGVEQAAREPLVGADVEAAEKPAGDGVVVADVLLGPPHLSLLATFLVFLRFGCLAFGGPVRHRQRRLRWAAVTLPPLSLATFPGGADCDDARRAHPRAAMCV